MANLTKMFLAAVDIIKENQDLLGKLDGATGDGDHGVAMGNAMNVVKSQVEAYDGGPLGAFLKDLGWKVMEVGGGSTSTILGSFFVGMKKGCPADADGSTDLDAPALAALFETSLAKVSKQSGAQVGDKTTMDALIPAVEALVAAAKEGKTAAEALAAAAQAAQEGADATEQMQAKFGRAKNLRERSIGHVDPGATSMSMIWKAFADNAE